MAKQKDMHDLFHETLKDIYFAEKHILRALPRMAKGAQSDGLRQAFLTHRDETEGQIERLDQVFELFGKAPRAKSCEAVRALFERIQANGLAIALGSSAKGEELEHYKKLADIADMQLVATTADDVERSKPHPDIFASALEKLGIAANEAIAVGDTPYDADSAGKAGIATIGLLGGGWKILDLLNAGCIAVYEKPATLLADYDKSPLARFPHSAD